MQIRAHRYLLEIALDGFNSLILVPPDIKGDNILQEIEDESIFDDFVQAELTYPSPRKVANGMTVYTSRRFHPSKDIWASGLERLRLRRTWRYPKLQRCAA